MPGSCVGVGVIADCCCSARVFSCGWVFCGFKACSAEFGFVRWELLNLRSRLSRIAEFGSRFWFKLLVVWTVDLCGRVVVCPSRETGGSLGKVWFLDLGVLITWF